jgi:hypothetical protein
VVWAYDLVSSRWLPRTVLDTFSRQHAGRFATIQVAGEAIISTYHHPYWVISGEDLDRRPRADHVPDVPENATTPGRWVDAGDLRPGDLLLLFDGRHVPVTAVEVQLWTQPVYNFSVDDLHTYAVGKHHALVHNNCAEDFISIEEFVEQSRKASNAKPRVSKEVVEDLTRLRAEKQLGKKLKKSRDPGVDYVDSANKTYDQMGNPNMIPHWDNQKSQFFEQIRRHTGKADHTIIDLTGFPKHIKNDVADFVESSAKSV